MKRGRLHIPGGSPMTAKQFIELYHVVRGLDPVRVKRRIKPHEVDLTIEYAMECTMLLSRLSGELILRGFIRQP